MNKTNTVYIGLGSNVLDSHFFLNVALNEICKFERVVITKKSGIYLTEPQDDPEQPWFLNQVIKISTEFQPEELLIKLQTIENMLGRVRTKRRFGPRNIDLDILLFGSMILTLPELSIPHPRLHNRAFVLVPLLEITPDAVLPDHSTVRELLEKIDCRVEGNKIFQNYSGWSNS